MLLAAAQGCYYLKRYTDEAVHLPYAYPARIASLRAAINWDEYVWLTTSGGIDKLGYASLVRLNWLNLGWDVPNLGPHVGKRIGIWCSRKDLDNHRPPPEFGTVLYEDDQTVLFDSGSTLDETKLWSGGRSAPPGEEERLADWLSACQDYLLARGL
jgi:hypothetical protein